MSRASFRVNLHSIDAWMPRNSLLKAGKRLSDSLSDSNGIRTHNYLVRKRTLNHLAKLALVIYLIVGLNFQ